MLKLLLLFVLLFPILASAQNNKTISRNHLKQAAPNALKQSASPKVHQPTKLSEADQKIADQRAAIKANQLIMQQDNSALTAVYQKYLGVASNKDPHYAKQKEKLYTEDPIRFQEFKEALAAISAKPKHRTLSRAKYNSLSKEMQQKIDNNPKNYTIVD